MNSDIKGNFASVLEDIGIILEHFGRIIDILDSTRDDFVKYADTNALLYMGNLALRIYFKIDHIRQKQGMEEYNSEQ